MSNSETRIPKAKLRDFVSSIFRAAGVDERNAEVWADVLVWANLRGVDSHGVIRIPRYIELVKRGAIKPRPDLRIESRAGAVSVLEADLAPGPVAMSAAMQEAIERARDVHVGWCAARNITHAGAIGYFALQAARSGMIGIVMTASGPLMAYFGSRKAGLSTNPLAIAVPRKGGAPFLLDMSTASVANGKILEAKERGIQIPSGWGIDTDGRDTTDPSKVATLLPMAGAKGSGLSFMIECLCSIAVGNPRIAPALSASVSGDSPIMNGVAIALDVEGISDPHRFMEEAADLGRAISALPTADGQRRIFLPGERGDSILRERERDGIPLPTVTWTRLVAAASSLNVPPPE
jgi:ureidoglycolate dehydrogenase (NAD+)